VKVSQFGWLTIPTKDSPLQLEELGIEWIVDHKRFLNENNVIVSFDLEYGSYD